jgi:hypothetical protein
MSEPLQIYLFDMDSVLLHPGGYRAALIATINHFALALGLSDAAPTLSDIETFESLGIASEWDMAAICVAAITLKGGRPDYRDLARRIAAEIREKEYPAETAYRVLPRAPFTGWGVQINDILLHSRDIHRSPVLAIFQQYTLGKDYERTYGLPCIIDTESTILKYDRPELTEYLPENSILFTSRPSKPPSDVPPLPGYAPEAELGVKLLNLSYLPVVGYGHMHWLAEVTGGEADSFLKPSPVHTLACLSIAASAESASQTDSLLAAEATLRDEWKPPLAELRNRAGRVTVFEDSAASIIGVREAVKMLGPGWECVAVGVASGGVKYDALTKVADRVYPSIDEAVRGEAHD